MTINSLNNLSISDQREELLKLNTDLLAGVYSLQEDSGQEMKLELVGDVLSCYPNHFEELQGLANNSDITIINLGALRKGEIEVFSGDEPNIINPVLLSNGVIEFIEAKNNKGEVNKHLISTLRDGGAADELQRTTTAGRNYSDDLMEDLEREHIEESPFLGKDSDGNYALASIDNSDESIEILKESINFFLERKYITQGDENYEFVKKTFENNFPGIKYDELGDVLKDIINNKRVFTYSTRNEDDFKGFEDDVKNISLGDSQGEYFTYFDKDNNTIEYRLLRTITGFNDGFQKLSNRPSRLYLESENQYPRAPKIENATDGYVPTIKYFSEKVEKYLNS